MVLGTANQRALFKHSVATLKFVDDIVRWDAQKLFLTPSPLLPRYS